MNVSTGIKMQFLLELIGRVAIIALILALSLGSLAEEGASERSWLPETVLLYQRDNGGWPKNYDRAKGLSRQEHEKLLEDKSLSDTNFDNGATYTELRYLARIFKSTGERRYLDAFQEGIDFVLEAQYENGGWPQFYPDRSSYRHYITFNDGAMVGVMELMRDVAYDEQMYGFVAKSTRDKCRVAYAKGLRCILESQIEVNGEKTVWCAQYDEKSLAPRGARSYELASLSGMESVGIVELLMSVEAPGAEIKASVQGAIVWFETVKLSGKRLVKVEVANSPLATDRVLIDDPTAAPLWARFYEIGTNRPFFCSRDGIPKDTLAEISYERRNGYSWLGRYASELLNRKYPRWRARHLGPGKG